ncbi:MAG: hypothetical protein EKK48_20260 [Candidatus Melainabacteria bacterium]|nr:MAG: hypothetical protein EKK48_20260 [Candidatus Melainabacteria bacterium]
MPPSDSSTVNDKTKDKKKDSHDGTNLSQEANDPKNQTGAKGAKPTETDQVPKATVTREGSIFFDVYNKKLQEAGVMPETATVIDKPANVQVDKNGHVTEVTLPNNQKRTFGYDQKGELNSITEPDGRSYKNVDGKWIDAQGKAAPFEKPAVSSNGDLVMTTADQRIVTESQDGKTTALNPKDNSVVTYDGNYHVTNVHYANGQSRSFTYDHDTLTSITETDGKVYTLKDNRWLGPDNANTFNSDAKVLPDGTYTYRQPDGKTISTSTSGQISQINPDGSVCHFDANHRISEIIYTDGKKTQFGYDDQGHPNKLITTDGKTLTLQDGKWRDAQNQDTGISDFRVQADGSFWFKSGNQEFINSTKDTQTSFDSDAIAKAAHDLKEAKDNSTLLIFDSPDTNKIWNILEPMSAAQRQLVAEEYAKQNPGHDLITDLKDKLSGPEVARAEALLKRQDGVADNTGQIHQALAKLADMGPAYEGWVDDDRVRTEKEIRDSINTLTADQLKAVEAKYKQDYGRDLMDDLQSNPNLSDESKQALQIYFKGNDHRSDEDTLKLANLAIEKGRPDIFDEVFRDASQSARDKFTADGGMKKIDDAFDGGDRQIAKDYLTRGCVSIATIVDGDTHWYHTNKDDITRAVTNASDKDRADFKRGEEIKEQNVRPPYSPEDQRALDFYNNVSSKLKDAGNDREADKWKAQLRNNESLITSLLDSHDDGGWFGIGSGTNKNRELSAVENISQQDWTYLKAHPEELSKIETALNHFDDSHKDQVMQMLHDKLSAPDFASSQKVGNRSLLDRLGDNGDNAGNRVDALAGMSPTERQQYLNNTDGFRDKINGQLKSDEEKTLTQRIAGTTGDISPTDRVLIDGIKNADPNQVFRDIEAAFKADPTLKDRINNPQTDEDKKLSQWYHSATHAAVDKAGLGDQFVGEGQTIPGEYATFEDAIFKNGHVPLDQQLRLTDDKQAKVDLILHASDADKARLLQANPDAETKAFQDAVLGTDKDHRAVLTFALMQKDGQGQTGYLSQADQFRLYALDGGNSDSLKTMLAGMTPEQRQNLANEYFTKYHSLITEDVIGKVPGDQQWRFRELLAPTDISVRQIALDAQMNNDAHTSSWDQFLKDNWDYTRVSADSSQDNLNKFIADHAAELDKLSPEQRKQFDDAIANYMQAQKAYIDSKGAFAEAFVDATITVAAIGGACFTGGTSLALLAAIGAGGAVYRTAMMASIQGTDFDSSAGNILKQSFEGGTQAVLGFLGPEQLGLTMGLKVGGELAEQTALHLVEGSTKALFKDGAETILKDELANLTRQGAILGDREIAAIAEKVAADGVDRNVVEQAIRQQLKSDTMSGLKNIVLNEGESYVKNMLAAQIGSQGKELLATAVGFESPDTLLERMKGTAISTVAGVTMFHGVFRLASSGEYVRVALGRDAAGNVVAGEGTVIRHADGTLEPVVGKETLVKLKPGDTIYEKDALHENPDGSKDLRVGDKTTHYDTNGRVTDVSNSATKTRTSVDYVENPVTKETVLNKALTYNPDGSIDTRASVMLDNGVYYRVNPDGSKGRAVGTDVSVSSDGSITVKGKPSGTNPDGSPISAEIGATRWNNGNPKQAVDSITLHPDGTKETHFVDNSTVNTDSFDRVTKLVSADGVTTKFEYSMNAPNNTDVNKLTIGDHTYIKQNGKYVDETGKPAADNIKVFKDGTVDIINPSDTLHTPTKPQEQIESVRIYKDGTTEYRYKSLSEAPTDKIDPPKAPTAEKVLEERIKSGDVKAQSDGTYVHEDPASRSRTVYDAKGEVVSVRNSAGQDINFTRDASGDLTKVEYSRNGKVESTYTREEHNGRMFWKETDANGRITGWKNEVRVEPDGSITKLENSADGAVAWSGVKERPDGTKIKIDTVGREKVDASALDTERVRVREFAERGFGGDPERQARFEKWMDDFEAAAAKRTPPLSQEEIANTYYQLDKLISTDNAILSQAERMKLAEQFMYKTSNPQTIGQGYFNTCNVTAEVENRLIQLHPSEALQMVTDVATTGKFITSSGSIIDMSAMNNVLTPFKDVANNAFNPANYGGRDYFDQLFQTTSIETFWQTQATNGARPTSTVWDVRAGNPFRPGDLRYEFSNTPGVSKTGEVINNYSTNPPTRQLAPKSSTMIDPLTGKPQRVVEWVPAESPNLSGDQMLQINKEIVGRNDPPHMLARNSDAAAVNINSSDELAAQLKQMQQNGGFPATVFVDTRDPLISGRPEDGGQGGAHVINVQNVFEKDGKLYVEFTNQWSSANDHLGNKAVPVEDLFRAMEYRPPEQAAVPPTNKTNNWVKYGVPLAGLTGTAAAAYAAYRILQDSTNKGNKNQPNPMDIYIEPPVQQKQDLEPNTNNSGSGGDGTGFVPQAQPGSQPADKGGR